MPRDNDKNNDSRAGATVRPAARAARAFLGGQRRNSPSAALAARRTASGGPMPAIAKIVRRAATTAMRRVGAATGRLPIGRRAAAMAKSVRSGRVKTVAATSVRTRRAGTGRIVVDDRDDARVRLRVSRTGNSATRNLTRRERIARSGPTRHAAKASARTATGREAIVRSTRDRAMAIVRAETGRSPIAAKENLTATRSFRAARARISADRPDRDSEFGRDRSEIKPWQKRDGASPDRAGAQLASRLAKVHGISTVQNSTSPVTTSRAIGDDGDASAFFASAR